MNNDITEFIETQINLSDFTWKTIKVLNFFSINFKNNKTKILILAYGCRNDVGVLDQFDANGLCIFNFKKHGFADRVFTLLLVHRKQPMQMQ